MIQRLLLIALCCIPLASGASAAEATTPAEFTTALKAAITAKDAEKLDALIYADGASPEDFKRITDMFRMTLMTGKEVEDITLEPLPEDFDSILIVRGRKIEPTAAPAGMVKVTFKDAENGPTQSSTAYAVVGGKFHLVGMKSTDLGWKGPADRNIGYSISGTGADSLQIHGVWNASGVQLKKAFKQTSITFWGQHIEELTVTSENADCDVTLHITEDGKTIHTEALKGKGVIQYKRTIPADE
jgi:hypothetical protein